MAKNQVDANGVRQPRKGMEVAQQSTTEPWGPTQPALNEIISGAQQQYQQGTGTALPDFSPIAGLSPGTQNTIGQIQNNATNGNPWYADLYAKSQAPNAASGYLEGVLGGNTRDNPYLDSVLSRGTEQIANRVNALKSAEGRYGGLGAGGHVQALGQAISDFQTPILYQNYNDAMNREMGAAGQLGGLYQNQIAQGAGIAGQQDTSNYNNLGLAMQAGGVADQNAAQQQQYDYQRWLWENGGADQASLQNYLNTIGGIAGLGGTQQVQQPYTPVKNLFGGLVSGLGALGSFL